MILSQEYIIAIALAIIILLGLIVIVREWRKVNEAKHNVLLLEKQTELKKINLVEKDLEEKRRRETLTRIPKEQQERLDAIKDDTDQIMQKIGYLNTEVNERVEKLEAETELVKLKKLSEELDKKESKLKKY
ncbi:MAG: hypothetical protein Q4Q23_00980 [Methanobacteriaceae archaeon]|nr:hypothetical protein [Methanobacteriaceae archaeon]